MIKDKLLKMTPTIYSWHAVSLDGKAFVAMNCNLSMASGTDLCWGVGLILFGGFPLHSAGRIHPVM